MTRKLIFRAEVSQTIGRGHLSRCLAIADMLKNNFDISFVFLRSEEDYASTLIKDYAYFLIDSDTDLLDILKKEDIFWIDGYHFSEEWKKEVHKLVGKFIETNDIPYAAENVDVIFNQTPGLEKAQFKDTKAALYLGLDYALLRQSFLDKAKEIVQSESGNGVFICFGGADTYKLGEKFVEELLQRNFKDPIYWVTNATAVEEQKYNAKNVTVLSNLNEKEMIHYMSIAKVVLIPSSVLSFEAMAIRKPIFTCYFVDNQKLINKGLLKQELANGVGYIETKKDVEITTNIFLDHYKNEILHKKQVNHQVKLLDGNSNNKIREIINQFFLK
jgi:spore coat polysaccharide biosynthesis predicted glycosyltransferase SpsG